MKSTINYTKAALVLAPTFVIALYFIWGFGGYTVFLSVTKSGFLPDHTIVGFKNFALLLTDKRWWIAYKNMFIFGGLYMFGCISLGALLAVLLDRLTRGETLFRTLYLYPMSLSLVVTGLSWQWLLNPTSGLQQIVRDFGYTDFAFNWLASPQLSIYTVVLAAIWNGTGFIMILFLAGIKAVDQEIWRAARLDRIPTWRVYVNIIFPQLRSILLTAVMLLGFQVVRSFDVVVALTGGGPGYSSDVPARYVFDYFFARSDVARGAAGAVVMVATMLMVIVPYLVFELRRKQI